MSQLSDSRRLSLEQLRRTCDESQFDFGSTQGVPPLAERPGNIRLLTRAFVEEFANGMGKPIEKISENCMRMLGIKRPARGCKQKATSRNQAPGFLSSCCIISGSVVYFRRK